MIRFEPYKLLILFGLGVIGTALTSAHAEVSLERDRFRAFIASVTLCAEEASRVTGGKCLKKAFQDHPESLKWISDPDRLVLLFQASRMDSESSDFIDGYRIVLEKNADAILAQIPSILPKMGGLAYVRNFTVGFTLPTLGLYLSSLAPNQLQIVTALISEKNFETLHESFCEFIEKIQPKKIAVFGSFFNSLNATSTETTARTQKLISELIENYFESLTVLEKSRIISDYFKTPIDASPSEKLRPLLQNLDPVMQKIFQLVGRLIKDPAVEEATAILQSSLEPFPIELMKRKVEERYGRPFDELFVNYDSKNMRRATTGQVLFADIAGTKSRVAIKVRIPGITERFNAARTRLLGLKAVKKNPGLSQFVVGLLDVIATELDYRNEAKYTDVAQTLYTDKKRGIQPAKRMTSFQAEEDLVVYAFATGVKPTKLTSSSDLAIRARLMRNLIELWTETVFFKTSKRPPNFY